MEAIVGIVIGVVATIWVAHYYYRRTVKKELSVFGLLNSAIFAGIAPDVRSELHFHFKDREVEELQQIMFLVANTGERAIRDLIAPLRLPIPATAAILDASIVHRTPENLQAGLRIEGGPSEGKEIHFDFPLLNKQEYFVIKLLLSGKMPPGSLSFQLLCDDLPRSIKVGQLPPQAFDDTAFKFEWSLAAVATAILAIPVWICYTLYVLHSARPDLFPYPWASYTVSNLSLWILIPAILFTLISTFLGLVVLGAALFGGEFPPPKGPRFPLPKTVRDAVFPFPLWRHHPEFGETPRASDERGEPTEVGKI